MNQVNLMIFASDNGRDNWALVKPADVPAWVKAPDNIGRMLCGNECMKADEGDKGSLWYRAIRVEDYERMVAAEAKRARRMAKNRLH